MQRREKQKEYLRIFLDHVGVLIYLLQYISETIQLSSPLFLTLLLFATYPWGKWCLLLAHVVGVLVASVR